MQLSGRRYYSPELGRWPSRDPLGDEAFFTQYARRFDGLSPVVRSQAIGELRRQTYKSLYGFVDNSLVNTVDSIGLTPTSVGTRYERTEAWWHVSLTIYGQDYGYGPEGTGWPAGFIGRTTMAVWLTSTPPRTEQPVYERFWGVFGDDGKTSCCDATQERRLQCANYYRGKWDFSFYWAPHSCGHYVGTILKNCCFILLPNATGESTSGE